MANCWQEVTSLAECPQVPLGENLLEVRVLTNGDEEPNCNKGSGDEGDGTGTDEESDTDDEDSSSGSEGSSTEGEEDDDDEDDDEDDDDLEDDEDDGEVKCPEEAGDAALPPDAPTVPDHLKDVIIARCKEKKKCPKEKKKKCKDECCKLKKKQNKKEKDAFALASCGQDPSCAINSALKCIDNMASCSDPCKKMKYLGQALTKINGQNNACWLGQTMESVNEAKCKSCKCQKKKKKKKKCKKKKKKKKDCCLVSV